MFHLDNSPKAVITDRTYIYPSTIVFHVVFEDGNTATWTLNVAPAAKETEQEWHTAQDEILEVLEAQVEEVAPEVHQVSAYIFMVPSSSEPNASYRVDLYNRSCTCLGYVHHRRCHHIAKAEAKCAEGNKKWQERAASIPAGWTLNKTTGWWHNHLGHRQNTMPALIK